MKNRPYFNWRKENEVRGKTYEATFEGRHQCVVDAIQASETHPQTVIIMTGFINGQKKILNTFLNGLMSPADTVRIQRETLNQTQKEDGHDQAIQELD